MTMFPTAELPPRDLRGHLLDDLSEIDAAVAGYRAGRLSAYQTVAIQLRNILTDSSRARPLLDRVVPGATFHRLRPPRDITGGVLAWSLDPRGHMVIGGPAPIIELDVTEELVGTQEWLDDWIVIRAVKIRDLIHEVGSKDVAHTDDSLGPAMSALESNQVVGAGGRRVEMARPVIVALGEYVSRRIHELLGAGTS